MARLSRRARGRVRRRGPAGILADAARLTSVSGPAVLEVVTAAAPHVVHGRCCRGGAEIVVDAPAWDALSIEEVLNVPVLVESIVRVARREMDCLRIAAPCRWLMDHSLRRRRPVNRGKCRLRR